MTCRCSLSAPLLSVLLTWYGSLQHETIHGHPTPFRRFNGMLGSLPLSLWIPYTVYRETHFAIIAMAAAD